MKNTTKRLISLVLVLCMLVGMLAVLPVAPMAATGATSGTYVKVGSASSAQITNMMLYRDYEDGLAILNGCAVPTTQAPTLALDTKDGNTFYRYSNSGVGHTYMEYEFGTDIPSSGAFVFQFNIMVESNKQVITNLIEVNPVGRVNKDGVYGLGFINTGKTYSNYGVFNNSSNDEKGYTSSTSCGSTTISADKRPMAAGTWYTVSYVFYGTDMANSLSVACYFNGTKISTVHTESADANSTDVRPGIIRFGGSSQSAVSYCIDDVIMFTTTATTDPATALGYTVNGSNGSCGNYFNAYAAPEVDPNEYNGNAFLKVGVNAGLTSSGTKVSVTSAPFTLNGEVYVPVSALNAVMGKAPAGGTETVNGISSVNVKNISTAYSGYYGHYSSMGLIGISSSDTLFYEGAELSLLPVMQKFIFDNVSTTLEKQDSFDVGDMLSTDHPYLYADQTRFDELRAVWQAGQAGGEVDPVLYSYINDRVNYAKRLYDQYAQVDASGNYTGMNTTVNLVRGHQNYIFEIPYASTLAGDGYDVGGRLGDAATNNERILLFAYAYQVTGDINYAKLAYQYAIYMGQWEHWGPGHFLNVADAASPYAVAYDWLFDAWTTLENEGATYLYNSSTTTTPSLTSATVSVAKIAEIIFTHGILPGFYSQNVVATATNLPWISTVVGYGGWNYHTRTNNWNAVCSAGTSLAALALIGDTTSTANVKIDTNVDGIYSATVAITTYGASAQSGITTYQAFAKSVINQNLFSLPMYGFEQYVPDGSYIESNGYWSYGTNNIFELAAALTSATGNDYGLLDAWGMDRTAYYALNTMSSDGLGYNYHDSNTVGAQDTSWFMYLAQDEALGDTTLAGIRHDLNRNVKQNPSFYDAIFYIPEDEITWEYPELQYYMEGIDGYVVRDSWNKNEGSMFAAFMGNTNNLGHGQIDSGAFVYYNNGVRWFCDLGTEDYNALGFWSDNSRYRYYVMGGEGNNSLILTSQQATVPYGQSINGYGVMYDNGNNAYGGYAIIDNTSSYGGFATSAKRGMLATNDHNTVIIQDEISFSSAQSVAWIGHILASTEVMLSVDGRTAYMHNGGKVLKVTLLSDNTSIRFSVRGTDTEPMLNCTFDPNYSYDNHENNVPQKFISDYKRLVVEASGITSLKMAVVIEDVTLGETMNDAEGIGYQLTNLANWSDSTPTDDNRHNDSPDDVVEGVIATVTLTEKPKVNNDGDTPIVDLYDAWEGVAAANEPAAQDDELEVITQDVTSFSELEALINSSGSYTVEVILYASNDTPITISVPCTVNTNGNKLKATSANLVTNVNGSTLSFEAGSISVIWHLADGTIKQETYTGTVAATYKGTIVEGTSLYEIENSDGTYSYYTSGNAWALTENGKQLGSEDMIVTSENREFWQTGKQFDGLFVTVKGSTITGYYSANDFFTSAVFSNTCDRISITNDFGYDATGKSGTHTFTYAANLHLNGYTITYTTTENVHMFNINNYKFSVYGPGAINAQTSNANMFYNDVSTGANIYVENADLYSVRSITDVRSNTTTLKNCNITIEQDANAIGVLNRGNVAHVDPKIVLDGCVITMLKTTTSSAIFSVQGNSTIEVTGGTSIISPTDCHLFILKNSSNPVAAADYDYDISRMHAIIGEVYSNRTLTTSKYESNHPSLSDSDTENDISTDYSGRVFYGESYVSDTNPTGLNILEGLVIARTENGGYILAKPEDCATVVWMNGGNTITTEYWVDGTTPVASAEIKAAVGAESGKMVSFPTEMVTKGQTYNLGAVIVDSFALQVNMSLQGDFNLNFYVENKGAMTFAIDGKEVTNPDTTSKTGFYKISKTGISPAMAAKAVKLSVTYNGNTVTKSISPIDYAEKILANSNQSAEARAMMINVVKYVEAAYTYSGNNVIFASDYRRVNSVYNKYRDLATASVVDRQNANVKAAADAIDFAELVLDSAPGIRFTFKSSYTGTVTLAWTNNGEARTETLALVNGRIDRNGDGTADGSNYYDVVRKAYNMTEAITVTTAGGTVSYSMANYYHVTAVEFGATTNLLNALYAYCETAKIYNDAQN